MPVKCPSCGSKVDIDRTDTSAETPVLICPKCKNLIFLKEPDPDSLAAEFAGEREAEKGPPANIYETEDRKKRYLALTLLLLAAFLGYRYSEYVIKETAASTARLTRVRSVLKGLAAAQENYYYEAGRYAEKLSDLVPAFKPPRSVSVEMISAGPRSWAAQARHRKNPEDCYAFDLAKGGFQEDCETGAETQ